MLTVPAVTRTALAALGFVVACGSGVDMVEPETARDERPASRPVAGPRAFVGVLLPEVASEVSATVDGRLAAIDVAVGTRVVAGATIARLEDTVARVTQAESAANLRASEAALIEAESERRHAHGAWERSERLGALGLEPADETLGAAFSRQRAESVRRRRQAELAAERARHDRARISLAAAQVTTPISGVVARVHRSVGDQVGPDLPIVRVVDDRAWRVRFAVPRGCPPPPVGAVVGVAVAGMPDPITASVTAVAPELDTAAGVIVAEASFESDSQHVALRGGTAASIHWDRPAGGPEEEDCDVRDR